MEEVFGVQQKLNGDTSQEIYDQISSHLKEPEFQPRALFDKFNIEVLCTTDAATDTLKSHQKIRESGWDGKILPTFRPDSVVDINSHSWNSEIEKLSELSDIFIESFSTYIDALVIRREFFRSMGATATDMAATGIIPQELSKVEVERIFQSALKGNVAEEDAISFKSHMILESARMSLDDGLVMQLHVGSRRNHNPELFSKFGPDRGADIPVKAEFTKSLSLLLEKFGTSPKFLLIVFSLDESAYSRELAPLAGHYPALKLGPPWWFHDSINGMRRYFDRVMETAGLYNTVGFNDDTRAFPSIPARHDVWRRASANWLAGLVVRGIVDGEDAEEMILDLAYNLAKKAYRL
jgi:glucuronate isomerase